MCSARLAQRLGARRTGLERPDGRVGGGAKLSVKIARIDAPPLEQLLQRPNRRGQRNLTVETPCPTSLPFVREGCALHRLKCSRGQRVAETLSGLCSEIRTALSASRLPLASVGIGLPMGRNPTTHDG